MSDYFLPNDYLEKLMTADLTKSEYKVALFLLRKTLGFGKISDDVAKIQFIEYLGIDAATVKRATGKLKKLGLLLVENGVGRGNLNTYTLPIEKGATMHPINDKRAQNDPHLDAKRAQNDTVKGRSPTPHKGIHKQTHASVKSITASIINEIAEKYKVTAKDVEDKWEALQLWLETEGRRKKNYKAFLMNRVRAAIKSGEIKAIPKLEQEIERRFHELQ